MKFRLKLEGRVSGYLLQESSEFQPGTSTFTMFSLFEVGTECYLVACVDIMVFEKVILATSAGGTFLLSLQTILQMALEARVRRKRSHKIISRTQKKRVPFPTWARSPD